MSRDGNCEIFLDDGSPFYTMHRVRHRRIGEREIFADISDISEKWHVPVRTSDFTCSHLSGALEVGAMDSALIIVMVSNDGHSEMSSLP